MDYGTALQPVQPSERIELLDVLRGFALIGVLYVNMHNFGSDEVTGTAHSVAHFFMEALFESKFFSLFSLLFGIGFAIQLRRAEARATPLFRIYWRRLVSLFAFGWIHALIYPGDIVRLYAVLGFMLFLFRDSPVRRLIWTAVAIHAIDFSLWYFFRSGILDAGFWSWGKALALPAGSEEAAAARTLAYTAGSIWDVMSANLSWHWRWVRIFIGYGPSALALFLLGFATVKSGLLDDIQAHRPLLRRLMMWMLIVGAPGAITTALRAAADLQIGDPLIRTLGSIGYNVSYPTLMIAYACFISLQYPKPGWKRVLHPLAAVGRMALTVYIGQSVIYTTIYYGYGLGLYGKLGPAHIVPLSAAIFLLELWACNWWMRRFRYGPLEWLWRTVTYMKWQPMRASSPLG